MRYLRTSDTDAEMQDTKWILKMSDDQAKNAEKKLLRGASWILRALLSSRLCCAARFASLLVRSRILQPSLKQPALLIFQAE